MEDVTACSPAGLYSKPESVGTITTDWTRSDAHRRGEALRALFGNQELLYAVRTKDGLVKIGHTANIRQRRNQLMGDLLGVMPGTHEDEQDIHRTLRPWVNHGLEWYNPTPEVLSVVNEMRATLGMEPLTA